MTSYLFVTVLVGLVCVFLIARLAIISHYRQEDARRHQGARRDDETVADLAAAAEEMERRIVALEAILDREAPDWRGR